MEVVVADQRGRRATVERLWSIKDAEDQDVIERFCDIKNATTLTLVDVCQDGGVLRRATMKCSLQIDVDVRLDGDVLRKATIKCSLRIEVDVVDVRLDGCAAKGDNEVLAVN
jgi:hypothetical protein